MYRAVGTASMQASISDTSRSNFLAFVPRILPELADDLYSAELVVAGEEGRYPGEAGLRLQFVPGDPGEDVVKEKGS